MKPKPAKEILCLAGMFCRTSVRSEVRQNICFIADVIAYNKRVGCVSRDFYSGNKKRRRSLSDHEDRNNSHHCDENARREKSAQPLETRGTKKTNGLHCGCYPEKNLHQEAAKFTTTDHPAYGERRSFH